MLRYKLRTLLILLAIGPPVLAVIFFTGPFAVDFIAEPLPNHSGGTPSWWQLAEPQFWHHLAFMGGPILYIAAWIGLIVLGRFAHRPGSDCRQSSAP